MSPKDTEKAKSNFWTEYEKFTKVFKLFPLTINLIRPQLSAIALTYFLSLVGTCLGMLEPKYVGTIVDIVTRSKDTDDLKSLVVKMVIFSAVLRLVNRASERASNKATALFKNSAKGDIYRNLLKHNMAFFDKMSTGEAAEAMSSGVDTLEYLYFNQFISVLQTVFTLVGSFFLMYSTCPRLTFIAIGLTPANMLLTYMSMKSNSDYYSEVGKLYNAIWTLPNQAIQNISLVKSFSTEKKEHKELVEKQAELTRAEDKRDGGFWNFGMMVSFVDNILGAVLIWFGGAMAFQGTLTPGELSTFNLYYSNFSGSFNSLNYAVKWLFNSFMQSEKLLKVLEADSTDKNQESKNITKSSLKGTINVNQLSFSYPSKPDVEVLKDINLKINAGESVAFVGASGSGKTTMVSLLQNLYTLNQGEIIIDGERIQDYDVAWLHQHVGYVSQEPVLLEKSVEENIAYGLDSHTPEQIDKALELSNAKFILNKEKFPDGLQTMIGAEGIKFSGGQKQRLAIARAFVKDPKILILDEPTSALDGESESKVQKAIDDLTSLGDRTVIVVAHRLSTIINCSKIVVFEDGKIVEEGTHRELIEKNGAYKKLFEFQMNSMKNL